MKTLNIVGAGSNGDQVFTVRPVARAALAALEQHMISALVIWIEEGFSTADAIMRDDCWLHMQTIAEMLPHHENPVNKGVDLDLLSNDYAQLEALFFGDAKQALSSLKSAGDDKAVIDFAPQLYLGSRIAELHHFEPKKKLMKAHDLFLEKKSKEKSGLQISRSKVAATKTPTRSPT